MPMSSVCRVPARPVTAPASETCEEGAAQTGHGHGDGHGHWCTTRRHASTPGRIPSDIEVTSDMDLSITVTVSFLSTPCRTQLQHIACSDVRLGSCHCQSQPLTVQYKYNTTVSTCLLHAYEGSGHLICCIANAMRQSMTEASSTFPTDTTQGGGSMPVGFRSWVTYSITVRSEGLPRANCLVHFFAGVQDPSIPSASLVCASVPRLRLVENGP